MRGDVKAALGPVSPTMGRPWKALGALVSLLALLMILPAAAMAGKTVDGFYGGPFGSDPGQFQAPVDVAVNQANGDVYVLELIGSRVQRFDAEGVFELTWGEGGGAAGQFASPSAVAIDQSDGSVYVYDRDNYRIQKFDPNGQFVLAFGDEVNETTSGDVCTAASGDDCKAGQSGGGAGQIGFDSSSQTQPKLAVDPTNGHVFVADPGNHRVLEFLPDGTFERAWGWGVDTGTEAFEICTAASSCQEGSSEAGSENGRFVGRHPEYLAIGADGILYASSGGSDQPVMRFDTTASGAGEMLLPAISTPPLLDPPDDDEFGISTRGLAIDSSTGNLLVARSIGFEGEGVIQEIDTSTLSLVDTHGVGMGFHGPSMRAVAHHDDTGRLYLVYQDSAEQFTKCDVEVCAGYFVLDDDGPSQPAVLLDQPTDVHEHSATLNGKVDPAGRATYQFQYSKNGVSWTSVGSPVGISGGSPIPVSAEVDGLEANTLYRVRIQVTKITSPSTSMDAVSPELTFMTDAVVPEVTTYYPQTYTDDGARFTGQINPNNLPTTYYFEYGESTGYGQKTPARTISGGVSRLVFEEVAGLSPDTGYHVRLVAQNSEGTTYGLDVEFSTRSATSEQGARAFEMVTPPYKVTRTLAPAGGDLVRGRNANPGIPSLDGNAFRMRVSFFPLLEETRFPFDGDELIMRRTPDGWTTRTRLTQPLLPFVSGSNREIFQLAGSGDLETEAWRLGALQQPAPLTEASDGTGWLSQYTRKDGTGVNGWTGWLTNPDKQRVEPNVNLTEAFSDDAAFNDVGTHMVRWGRYRGVAEDPVTPEDDDPSDNLQTKGPQGGSTVYLQQGPPNGEIELVNECTGTTAGGDATQILTINDNGTPFDITKGASGFGMADDYVDVRTCPSGSITSVKGAVFGGNGSSSSSPVLIGEGQSQTATAMSNDGRRVFFLSPDPTAAPQTGTTNVGWNAASCKQVITSSLTALTGPLTSCAPQLFVRQYDDEGDPTVRWISQARGIVGKRHPNTIGTGVTFEGASIDGRYVYFKTDAPLVPTDQNGGTSVLTGANANSMDLYRYDLGDDLNADPGNGQLVRITSGPTGSANPSTNTSGANGGTAARYISDDGKRVYFVTRGVIPGADTTPPANGTSSPSGTNTATATRNLYLFDDTGDVPTWTFVAQLPFGDPISHSPGKQWDSCATSDRIFAAEVRGAGNCFRGTADGRVVTFVTQARLSQDDKDDAVDIYLYDAGSDDLIRISAPPLGTDPYVCSDSGTDTEPVPTDWCNAEYQMWSGMRMGGKHFNIAEDASGAVSVYFQTRLQLLPQDQNVGVWDVYQWREGELSMISRGRPGFNQAYYSGNSIDGRDVFIQTSDRIDPREIDPSDLDIYDARIGGGFPYTPPPVPCDPLALACEGDAATPPSATSPSTSGFAGEGNRRATNRPRARRCPKGKVRRRGKCVKKKRRGRHHSAGRNK